MMLINSRTRLDATVARSRIVHTVQDYIHSSIPYFSRKILKRPLNSHETPSDGRFTGSAASLPCSVYTPKPRVKRGTTRPHRTVQDGLLLEKSRLCQTRVVLNDQLLVADHGNLFALGLALKLCVQLLDLNVQVCGNLGRTAWFSPAAAAWKGVVFSALG